MIQIGCHDINDILALFSRESWAILQQQNKKCIASVTTQQKKVYG